MVQIKIVKSEINDVDMNQILEFISWNPQYKEYMQKKPGEEVFKLLAYLSRQIAKVKPIPIISDIATHFGCTALALASYPSVQVTTYDIIDYIPQGGNIKTLANIPTIKRKFMSGQLDIVNIAKSDLIMFDMEPHNGIEEMKFVKNLQKHGFKGLLVVGNINITEGMKSFWQSLPSELTKFNVTEIGHWAGTGIIVFDSDAYEIKIV